MLPTEPITVLHYVGCDDDRGGILSHVRALASAGDFKGVLGVNPGFRQSRSPEVATCELPRIAAESIGPRSMLQARTVALAAQEWLRLRPEHVLHAHSRAGLLVALWLRRWREDRVVVSVHCYGSQRWFYRWAARQLGGRLYWLTPAMKRHYGVGDGWEQCVPSCALLPARVEPRPPRSEVPVRFAGIGSIVAWKGWHLVLEALALLPADVRASVRFTHLGSAEPSAASRRYADGLRRRAAGLGLEGIVTWRGEATSSGPLLREIDCLLVPSIAEPLSLAMLEALAVGVPVLATDSGGPADVITAGADGWLFRSGDAADLARRMAGIVQDGLWAKAGFDPGRYRRFAPETVARQWLRIYGALADAGTRTNT